MPHTLRHAAHALTLDLSAYPQRIQDMVAAILHHQAVLCAYDQGGIELNYNGPVVRLMFTKVPLPGVPPLEQVLRHNGTP